MRIGESAFAAIVALSLAGCSTVGLSRSDLRGASFLEQNAALAFQDAASPRDYAVMEMANIYRDCTAFFDNAARVNQTTSLVTAMLSAGSGLASAVVASANLAKWTGGIAATSASVLAFARQYGYGDQLANLKKTIQFMLTDSQPRLVGMLSYLSPTSVYDYADANFVLAQYADYCSLSSIQSTASQALAGAVNHITTAPTGGAGNGGGGTLNPNAGFTPGGVGAPVYVIQ